MESRDHLVSLKVMRLLKPSTYCTLPVYSEKNLSTIEFSNILLEQAFNHDSISKELNNPSDSSQTDFLVIPQIFGNLYIGEKFTCYICLYNQSVHRAKELSVKVELQTAKNKIPIKFVSEKNDFLSELEPDQKFDGIIEHDVIDLGNHILICMVSYVNEKGERLSFKKFYKFLVSQPFEIKTTYPFDKQDYTCKINQDILFQAQIHNITNNFLYMENVQFQPSNKEVNVTEIRPYKEDDGSAKLLKPSEIRQYLFKISRKCLDFEKPGPIGKLDITWKYSFGENGHIQTLPLTLPPAYLNSLKKDVELKFECEEQLNFVSELVVLKCEIKNNSDVEFDLEMNLENCSDDDKIKFFWHCDLDFQIGKLAPKSSCFVNLAVVPLCAGLLKLDGIWITDVGSKRKIEFSQILNVFVINEENKEEMIKNLNLNANFINEH